MSTARLSYPFRGGLVEVDEAGLVVAVRGPGRAGLDYVRRCGIGKVVLDGRRVPWTEHQVTADDDEVEVTWSAPDLMRATIRHSFVGGWTTRLAATNLARTDVEAARIGLSLEPATARVGWALAAGSEASWAALPRDGKSPLLHARLTSGHVSSADDQGLESFPITLPAGSRYVLQLQWDWHRSPRALTARLPRHLPRWSTLLADEPLVLATDPDTAVVATPGLHVEEVSADQLVVTGVAGDRRSHRLGLRSARGEVVLEPDWAPAVADVLRDAAAATMTGPRTPAGVVRLPDLPTALVVQHARRLSGFAETEAAEEALDLFTARRPEPHGRSPLWAIYLTGEHARLDDPELLDDAHQVLLDQHSVTAGLGLAAVRLAVGSLLAGRASPRLDHVTNVLLPEVRAGRDEPAAVRTLVAELELLVSVRDDGVVEIRRRASGLAELLGVGVPGRAVEEGETVDLAHLTTVLRLLPEPLAADLARRWACSLDELVEHALADLARRLGDTAITEAHAWLTLSHSVAPST